MRVYTVSFFGHRVIKDPLMIEQRLETLIRRLMKEKEYVEFLVGRALKNDSMNLGVYNELCEVLEEFGSSFEKVYACEVDPGLGNGGLGRLAACYLDGLATQGFSAMGYCILYECGIFRQKLDNGWHCLISGFPVARYGSPSARRILLKFTSAATLTIIGTVTTTALTTLVTPQLRQCPMICSSAVRMARVSVF